MGSVAGLDRRELDLIAGRLAGFAGAVSDRGVLEIVEDSARRSAATAPDWATLVVRTEMFAEERLKALSHRWRSDGTPVVLFVCGGNSGRSITAAALTAHRSAGRIAACSAGVNPGSEVRRSASMALAEWGLDVSAAFPKPVVPEVVAAADVVVAMDCGDPVPLATACRHQTWSLADAAGPPLAAARLRRDEIDHRVHVLIDELASSSSWISALA